MSRGNFSKEQKEAAWNNAYKIDGVSPKEKRKDFHDRTIAKSAYGDEDSSFGWNIHHKNGNWRDNRYSNLVAVHYDTHKEIHQN